MSFYKKIKEDAKRQKKEIMAQGEGYYYATVFEHYGEAKKRQFSLARVLTNTAFLAVILIAGIIWGIYGMTGDLAPLSSESLRSYISQEHYEEKSLIYNGDVPSTDAACEFSDNYKVGNSSEEQHNIYLKQQEGVVLTNLSFFGGQSARVSYRVFVNENDEEMYYLFTVNSQKERLEIITFIKERYSSSLYKREAQRKVIEGKTVYLKSMENNGEAQYEVFFRSGQKGVYLVLTAPADTAYALLENILANLTD